MAVILKEFLGESPIMFGVTLAHILHFAQSLQASSFNAQAVFHLRPAAFSVEN